MEAKITKTKYLSITFAIFILAIINISFWQNIYVGSLIGLAFLFFYGFIFGSLFVAERGWQILLGAFFLIALIALLGGSAILVYQLSNYVFLLILLFIPAALMIPYYRAELREKFSLKKTLKDYLAKFDQRREPKTNFILVLFYLMITAGCFYLLDQGQTVASIQSPWETVHWAFIPAYSLAGFILIVYLFQSFRTKLPLALISLYAFLSSSVALIVYKIGYGFDPFIHQAAEKIIDQTGIIAPKTLYYLGQYGLVIFFHKLTLVDLTIIDRLLVPAIFSIFVPPIIFFTFSQWFKKNYSLILAFSILLIPYTGFIMTAPQNLANIYFIATILLSMAYFRDAIPARVLYLLAAATLIIHPLAGIPLLICVVLFNIFKAFYSSYRHHLPLYFWTSLVFIPLLPLAFFANGATINLPTIHNINFNVVGLIDKFDLPLNFTYFISLNKIILAAIVIFIGLKFVAGHKLLKNNSAYLTAGFVLLADFIIVKYFIEFPALSSYDQNDFTNRLIWLVFYTLLPFFLVGIYQITKIVWSQDFFYKSFLTLGLTALASASLYLSYPRLNQYEPAKFFSLGQADIDAVNYIEQIAAPNHLVLANQMVGAAAIKEFGFKKYYDGQFFYSMPNGSPKTFYDAYLSMVYNGANRETMVKIMNDAQVNESYFVINKYWNNFEKIVNQASDSADKVYAIDNGQIFIFRYQQ
ncbi:MAG: hypothetical protein PHW95_00760 [Patescibacteria group bacterium]|nr:hypothetical protein [Patescibacteria group bacterium]